MSHPFLTHSITHRIIYTFLSLSLSLHSSTGEDFLNKTMVAEAPGDGYPPTLVARNLITINDDQFNEDPQTFFAVATVELDYDLVDTKVCFIRHEIDISNCSDVGVVRVTIIDNDRKLDSWPFTSTVLYDAMHNYNTVLCCVCNM